MIKYSTKTRPLFTEKQDSNGYVAMRETLPNSKGGTFKVDLLGLSRISQNENKTGGALTPRVRACTDQQQPQETLSKSINTTPTK